MSEEQVENTGVIEDIAAAAALEDINIEDSMARDYIDYSMSVIVGRALPDVRDGLKPVHRRCLFAMHELGNTYSSKHVKSARVVGEVIGKYHPHGDSSVYDAIVRLAQDFSLRLPLVDGHGNFGSIDGDPAAAMRYTEVRMQKATEELLDDLEKDTVDMMPNFDETLQEPTVLPAKLPNLLLNGSAGIAVGMATNIPPHNLGELCDGISSYVQHREECTVDDLMKLVKDKVIEGISDIRDLSGGNTKDTKKKGKDAAALPKGRKLIEDDICIVVDLKRDAVGEIVLNHLYKHTQLQTTFGAILLAIVGGRPKVLNLKDYFKCYTDHRFEVITRRTRFDLKKALARKHIVDGLLLAIDNLDEVVNIIRSSKTRDEAKTRLQERFQFSDLQVNAILEMRLYQLVGLAREALAEELAKLIAAIAEYEAILADPEKVYAIICADLEEIKAKYCQKEDAKRRTEIVADANEVSIKDLIPDEPCVITLSNRGYVKRVPLTEYKEQRRGGHGVKGAQVKEEDFLRLVFVAETHDELMFFTNTGRLFVRGAYEIPEAPRTSFGRPLINLLNLQEGEQVLRLLPIRSFEGDIDVFFTTKLGTVKKTLLGDYQNVNKSGIRAINIEEGDELVEVRLVKPGELVIMLTANGIGIKFLADEVRRMGRTATGVKGITLQNDDHVVSLDVCEESKTLLVATENGYGKRTEFGEYRQTHRGGMGVTAIKNADRNGHIVAAHAVADDESIISITSDAQMVRSPVNQVGVYGRSAQGVRLVRLSEGAKLVSVSVCEGEENETPAPDAPQGGEANAEASTEPPAESEGQPVEPQA